MIIPQTVLNCCFPEEEEGNIVVALTRLGVGGGIGKVDLDAGSLALDLPRVKGGGWYLKRRRRRRGRRRGRGRVRSEAR